MSAMHAMALPDHDPDRRSAVICRFHGRAVRSRAAARAHAPAAQGKSSQASAGRTLRGPASAPGPAHPRAASSGPVRAPGTSSGMARGQVGRARAATAPLRLTRRGRVVIAVAVAIVLTTVSLIASGVAQATNHPARPGAAGQHLSRVDVRPGQNLWSVAASADPGTDTRLIVQQIIELNGLTSDVVHAGQELWVPRG